MAIVRINGKEINTVNGKKVRAIHYGDKTWYLEEPVENFTYSILNEEVTIDKYNGENTSVVIPSYIESKPVTTIGANAFLYKTSIKSITLPSTLQMIGSNAFKQCYLLQSIIIPKSVTSIEFGAFSECNNLTSVIYQEGSMLTSIGNGVFYPCPKLFSMVIPSNVVSLGDNALKFNGNWNSLTDTYHYEFKAIVPPSLGTTVFPTPTSTQQILEIKVPKDYIEDYKTWDTNWEALASYIVEGE